MLITWHEVIVKTGLCSILIHIVLVGLVNQYHRLAIACIVLRVGYDSSLAQTKLEIGRQFSQLSLGQIP